MNREYLPRWWILLIVFMLGAFVYAAFFARPAQPAQATQKVELGTSVTDTHFQWLAGEWRGPRVYKLSRKPPRRPIDRVLALRVKYARLTAQWDQVEPRKDDFQWAALDEDIAACVAKQAKVILGFGYKTQRGPETHLPDWAKNLPEKQLFQRVLVYARKVVERYKNDKRVWLVQVENEPLDPGGPNNVVTPRNLLIAELELAAKMGKPLMLTFEAGRPAKEVYWRDRGQVRQKLALVKLVEELRKTKPSVAAQIKYIGLDLYICGTNKGRSFFNEEWNWDIWRQFGEQIRASGMTAIIAELQAEPWFNEPAKVDYRNPYYRDPDVRDPLASQYGYFSFNPRMLERATELAVSRGFPIVLFWGVEHWLACEDQGNRAWINTVKELNKKYGK